MEQRTGASNRSVAGPDDRVLRRRAGIVFWALLMAAFLFLGFRWNNLRFRQASLDYLQARNAVIEFADEPSVFWRPLQPLVGDDAFRRVRRIDLSLINAEDADLAQIAAIEELESLDLRNAVISDQGAGLLGPLRNLQTLNLAGSAIGTAGIAKLPNGNLRSLDLSETRLNDGAIEIIAGWQSLETVSLRSAIASDIAIAELRRLPRLTKLDVSQTAAASETLNAIGGHPNLKHLELDGCPITDEDMELLASCQSMETLSVASTGVGDVGISRLAACKCLKKLVLRSTRATDRSLVALRPLPELNEIQAEDTEVSRAALESFHQRNSKQRKPLPGSGLGLRSPYVIGQVCECG
jgi:hypothetical protein